MLDVVCSRCGQALRHDHADPSFRWYLSNQRAHAGSRMVELREQVARLKGKRWSKAFAKQREKDLALLAALENELAEIEGKFAGFCFLESELYG